MIEGEKPFKNRSRESSGEKVAGKVFVGSSALIVYSCIRETTQNPLYGVIGGVLVIGILYGLLGIGKELEKGDNVEMREIVNFENPKNRY